MSQQPALHAAQIITYDLGQPAPVVARWALMFAVTVTKWDCRHRTRKALAKLTPEQLHDIGIARDAAYTEAARPFWRD
ncbi:DUF1127 domain-containing protein [Thalassovita taeanensis]|uniref:YjiS-like domain-containing protein n=1 Tax=Thalassovita taeanensis TaxID=657014 RepID=A0A1H8Z973_9RHOB|nr:DUF1127 domain-containing protein [Thalassovita taeanensis]SEP60946.1 protein of unknown function [Thalassovita taeanensis]